MAPEEGLSVVAIVPDQVSSALDADFIPFPDDLKGKYQAFTQADLGGLRAAGYIDELLSVQDGVRRYCEHLLSR